MSSVSFLPEPGSFFAGGFSGVCGLIVSQPFEIIKVRLQNSGGNDLSIFLHILKYEGIAAFWKGSGVSLIGTCFGNALSFGIVENVKSRLSSNSNRPLTISDHAFAGACSGVASSFITSPTEGVRIMLQTQGYKTVEGNRSTFKALYDLGKYNGIFGVYRGFWMTLIRDVVGDAVYFASYQWVPRIVCGGNINTEHRNLLTMAIAGGVSGILYWTAIYPVDTIKSRIQADCVANPRFKGSVDCFRQTVKEGGVKSLFNGYFMCILRAFPVNIGLVAGYEMAMRFIGRNY